MAETPEDVYRAAAEALVGRPFFGREEDGLLRHWSEHPMVRAVVDVAYAAGREAQDAGPCMDPSPRFAGCTPLLCELRAGHIGGHESGTTRWTKADVGFGATVDAAYDDGFAAGREAAAQAVLDEAAALGWEDDALTTYADAARLARGGTASSTKAHDAAQAIEATLAAREAQGCTYVRIADVRQALGGDR